MCKTRWTKSILLSQTNMLWLFFIQNLLCNAQVELLLLVHILHTRYFYIAAKKKCCNFWMRARNPRPVGLIDSTHKWMKKNEHIEEQLQVMSLWLSEHPLLMLRVIHIWNSVYGTCHLIIPRIGNQKKFKSMTIPSQNPESWTQDLMKASTISSQKHADCTQEVSLTIELKTSKSVWAWLGLSCGFPWTWQQPQNLCRNCRV
jgi:hypothetical protein